MKNTAFSKRMNRRASELAFALLMVVAPLTAMAKPELPKVTKSQLKSLTARLTSLMPVKPGTTLPSPGIAAAQGLADYLSSKEVRQYLYQQYYQDLLAQYHDEIYAQKINDGKSKKKAEKRATEDAKEMAEKRALELTQAQINQLLTDFPDIYQGIRKGGHVPSGAVAIQEAMSYVQRLVRYANFQTLDVPSSPAADKNWDKWVPVSQSDLGSPTGYYVFSDTHGDFPSIFSEWIHLGIIDADLNVTAKPGSVINSNGDNIDGKPFSEEILLFLDFMAPKLKAANVRLVLQTGNHEAIASAGKVKEMTAEQIQKDLGTTTVGEGGDASQVREFISEEFLHPDSQLAHYIRSLQSVTKTGDLLVAHAGVDAWADSHCNGNTLDRINYTQLQWFLYFQGLRADPPPANTGWVLGIKSIDRSNPAQIKVRFTHDVGPTMDRNMGNTFAKQSDGSYRLIKVDQPNQENPKAFPGPTRESLRYIFSRLGVKQAIFGHKPNKSGKPEVNAASYYMDGPGPNGEPATPLVRIIDSATAFGGQTNGVYLEQASPGKWAMKKVVTMSGEERYKFPETSDGMSALEKVRREIGTFDRLGLTIAIAPEEQDDFVPKTATTAKSTPPMTCGAALGN